MQLVPTNTTFRISLLLIVAVIASAVVVWFLTGGTPSTPVRAQEKTTVDVGDIWLCSPEQAGVCETTIAVGDSITWDFTGSIFPHTATECGASCVDPTDTPLWDSGEIAPGSPDMTFEFQFDQVGTFLYYCEIHPSAQLGRVVVTDGGPSPTATSTLPAPPATATPTQTAPPPSATATPTQTAPPPSATPAGVAGDANCDGSVTSIDSLLILQFVAGLLNELSCADNADVNDDGTANPLDSALILQFVAGLIPEL